MAAFEINETVDSRGAEGIAGSAPELQCVARCAARALSELAFSNEHKSIIVKEI